MPGVKPYRWLAEYYDRVFGKGRAPFAAGRRAVLKKLMPSVRSVCDLACGTGDTALEFAGRGLRVYGVDLSPGMCAATRVKVRRAGADVRVIRADMRSFVLPEPVDLITCEFDALNHVPRRADLRLVARAASRALRPGGIFFFDVNNSAGFAAYWKGAFWIEAPGIVAVMTWNFLCARDSSGGGARSGSRRSAGRGPRSSARSARPGSTSWPRSIRRRC
jgi:SAM-dependent methyltransferase